ncbi:DNA-3-methyladenine glycosylase family protein [Paludifilum halophilum]|uniref:DNA-3-methyladenine glycosylase family protein n=1 Tax=Paludifilum halophilum TaxID=1642702 RepID=UPI001F0B6EA3|nr:DNA-3-methyladenine glycosylase [Paludifilum halophilum]
MRSSEESGERMLLRPQQPYSYEETIRRLVSFEKTAYRSEGGKLYRTLRLSKRPVVVELEWEEEKSALAATVDTELDDRERMDLERILRRMFSLDVNLAPFYESIKMEPRLAQVVEERKGLHFVLDPTLYECLIKTIIGQQLNMAFAAKLVDRLIHLAGERLERAGEVLAVFPTPEQVARLRYEDLQALQFNRRKAEYVIDLSRRIAEGKLNLDELHRLEDQEVVGRLLPLRGIGRWTAECLLLFGMGRPNLLPAADIGLRNAVRRVYELDAQPTEKEVRQMGEAWSPWRSYATFYLWDTLSGQ